MCFGTILLGSPSGFYLLPMQDIWIVYGASDLNYQKIQKIQKNLKPSIQKKEEKVLHTSLLHFQITKKTFSQISQKFQIIQLNNFSWNVWKKLSAWGGYDLRGRNRLLMGTTMFMSVMPWLRLKHHIGMPAVREVTQWFCKGWSLESTGVQRKMKDFASQKAFLKVTIFFCKDISCTLSRYPEIDWGVCILSIPGVELVL